MKKGISEIAATVLIILITVAAMTIIWAAILPILDTKFEGFENEFVIENKGILFMIGIRGLFLFRWKERMMTLILMV